MTFCYQEHKIYLYLAQKLCFKQQTAQSQKGGDRHEQKCVACIRLLWKEKLTVFRELCNVLTPRSAQFLLYCE